MKQQTIGIFLFLTYTIPGKVVIARTQLFKYVLKTHFENRFFGCYQTNSPDTACQRQKLIPIFVNSQTATPKQRLLCSYLLFSFPTHPHLVISEESIRALTFLSADLLYINFPQLAYNFTLNLEFKGISFFQLISPLPIPCKTIVVKHIEKFAEQE